MVAFDQRLQVGRVCRPRRTSKPEHRIREMTKVSDRNAEEVKEYLLTSTL